MDGLVHCLRFTLLFQYFPFVLSISEEIENILLKRNNVEHCRSVHICILYRDASMIFIFSSFVQLVFSSSLYFISTSASSSCSSCSFVFLFLFFFSMRLNISLRCIQHFECSYSFSMHFVRMNMANHCMLKC